MGSDTMTTTAIPIPPFYCGCGANAFPSEIVAREAMPEGAFKCPLCNTFASDHACNCGPDTDFRCWDCDTRHGSHGGPDSEGWVWAERYFERALANGGVAPW
jgi:hypothetical protein